MEIKRSYKNLRRKLTVFVKYEDKHCAAATNFCTQVSLAGTQTVE